jgi:hypothetical protein
VRRQHITSGTSPQPCWYADLTGPAYGCVLGQAQIAPVLLGGVQPEDGMQAVQQCPQVGDVGIVGRPIPDVVQKLAAASTAGSNARLNRAIGP